MITGVAHFDDISPRLDERVFEAKIEVQARVIVALGDDAPPGIADGDERIDILAESVADRLEADTLTRGHVDGEAIHRRLAEMPP